MAPEHLPTRKESMASAQKRQTSLMAEIKRALEGVIQRIDLFQHLFPTIPPTVHDDDIVILLLGETGSGRTTFIRNFMGQPIPAGASLECDTSRIEFVPCVCPEFSDRRIVFIDTPGFNHKNRKDLSDMRVLQLILTWCNAIYRRAPTAILYFYDMNASRLHCRLEDIARRLPTSQVIITTTMWNDLPDDAIEASNKREQDLRTLFETNHAGSISKQYPVMIKRLPTSDIYPALSALFDLIKAANDHRRKIIETDLDDLTRSEPGRELRFTVKSQLQTLDQIRDKIREGKQDYMALDSLRAQYISIKGEAKNKVISLQRSKVPVPPSIVRVVQRDPAFGVWSKALNSRLQVRD